MWKINIGLFVLIGCFQNGTSQVAIPTFDMELKNLLLMQRGYGFPHEMTVMVGHEALMRIEVTAADQQTCNITTPTGVTFDVSSPPSNRFEAWGNGCGVRVKHVQTSDYGRWRMTSTGPQGSFTGWSNLYVEEDTSAYLAPPLVLHDGEQANLDLTSLDNAYCVVAQPFSQSSLVPGHCRVSLEKASRAVQGNWNVLVGLPGRVSELHVDRRVYVEAERLDVGYVHDSSANKINLYCNILHTAKNITFCRFQRTSDSAGYSVMEGLSDGSYSYYGNGFVAKQCGMTIESPTNHDYGTWRCSVGSHLRVGNSLVQQPPLQALINVPPPGSTAVRQIEPTESEPRTIFVEEDLSFTITCQADTSLSYCWFMHPNGSQYSPLPQTSEDQTFWYTGDSLQMGDCGITFSHAKFTDTGDWICHMGAHNFLGVELTDSVTVRVTGPLAAREKEIDVTPGANVTIHCHTSNGNRPLDYCRFFSPNRVGISLDDTVTRETAILDRYFFTPGHSLDYGDCSLTIDPVTDEDIGQWSCAAVINTEIVEASDTIELSVSIEGNIPSELDPESSRPLSRAGITGMAVGVSILFVVLGGAIWYKANMPLPRWIPRRNTQTSQQQLRNTFDMTSFGTASGRASVRSAGSVDSSSSGGSDVTFSNIRQENSSRTPVDLQRPTTSSNVITEES